MSDTLYIKPDKEKTYSINSEEELNYYKSLRPIRLWSRTHFKCKCSKCHEDKDILFSVSSWLIKNALSTYFIELIIDNLSFSGIIGSLCFLF